MEKHSNGAAEFQRSQRDYEGRQVPPDTGVTVGEWLDWSEPDPVGPHEAVCDRCFLVGSADLVRTECGNCYE